MQWNTEDKRALLQAFMCARSVDELRRFLRDLCTEGEIEEFAKRFSAAKMLQQKVPYSSIERQTGLSSTTVARVARWLQKGAGGYRLVLGRLKKTS